MIIIGSKALSFYISDIKYQDIDLIGCYNDVENLKSILNPKNIKEGTHSVILCDINREYNDLYDTKNIEIHLIEKSESLRLYSEYINQSCGEIKLAPLEVLFSIKKSHIHYPLKFEKHIKDYCIMFDSLDGVDKLDYITKVRIKETEERLGKIKTPSLKKTSKEFFGQSEKFVKSFFIHDDMHKIVAHYDIPLYEKMKDESDLVFCSKEKWNNFPLEDRIKTVLEEAYVIALERKILPMLFSGGDYWKDESAFKWALMRICTNLTSGFFREFATNNYLRILDSYNRNYVLDFLEKYNSGLIKRIK
jgi:uncharacterized protein (UPF0332 family)